MAKVDEIDHLSLESLARYVLCSRSWFVSCAIPEFKNFLILLNKMLLHKLEVQLYLR